jgi:hypothetical protein
MTPDEKQRRAEHARRLLDDALLAEVFDGLIDEAKETSIHGPSVVEREEARDEARAVQRVRNRLHSLIDDAKLAGAR